MWPQSQGVSTNPPWDAHSHVGRVGAAQQKPLPSGERVAANTAVRSTMPGGHASASASSDVSIGTAPSCDASIGAAPSCRAAASASTNSSSPAGEHALPSSVASAHATGMNELSTIPIVTRSSRTDKRKLACAAGNERVAACCLPTEKLQAERRSIDRLAVKPAASRHTMPTSCCSSSAGCRAALLALFWKAGHLLRSQKTRWITSRGVQR
jgi:hypothetical protein